ncbi:MAG: bifunctional pyr operon transcriptional regulator/uracil phosphoribosyltransferase PyrR [Candidatus Aminicenantes bacterium]|nr:bifunctional pyr operon transcriptional regulator/uracil phosphoribosyltransferase PyrR [Candidatus Aminicenantes bacterium]
MKEKIKAAIMDAAKIRRVLFRLATEILERNRDLKNLVIVGIPTRGLPLARRLAGLIRDMEGVEIPVAALDISPYRDDRSASHPVPAAGRSVLPFPIARKNVILVDDVLFTGRTIRAAMDSLFDIGRAETIQLLVLIDRGHRELPIRADYVGKVLPTSRREIVQVRLRETDKSDEVLIAEPVALSRPAARQRARMPRP